MDNMILRSDTRIEYKSERPNGRCHKPNRLGKDASRKSRPQRGVEDLLWQTAAERQVDLEIPENGPDERGQTAAGDFLNEQRQKSSAGKAEVRGKMTFGDALQTYRERLNGDHSLKERSMTWCKMCTNETSRWQPVRPGSGGLLTRARRNRNCSFPARENARDTGPAPNRRASVRCATGWSPGDRLVNDTDRIRSEQWCGTRKTKLEFGVLT